VEKWHCGGGGICKVLPDRLGFLGDEGFVVANDIGFVLLSSNLKRRARINKEER
jgi:hypothetical protein